MRLHPRKEAGVVVDFVQKGATHTDRVVTLHSLLGADFYREGARVTPAPRRRVQRKARRKLSPAPWLVPVTPDVSRRLAVIQREWQRVDPRYLDEEEQRFWARIAGRQARFDDRVALFEKLTARASKAALEQFLFTCAAENPNRRLRMMALSDRVGDDRRPRELRRPRHARHPGAAVGEGPRPGRPRPAARDRRGAARRARPDPRPLDVAARPRGAQGARPQGERRVPRGEAPARRARELARPPARGERGQARNGREGAPDRRPPPRCSPRPRATRRARTTISRRRARSSARSRRSQTRSPTTCPRRRRTPAGGDAGGARRSPRAPRRRTPRQNGQPPRQDRPGTQASQAPKHRAVTTEQAAATE